MILSDLPNFTFIVGAPRCGTTTLANFLRDHPRVCYPAVKEPHFFLQHDVTALHGEALHQCVEREFLDRFYADCPSRGDIGVDGSVSYLYAPERLLPALELWPEARFIIAVRDPLTMLPSLHARLKYTGDENIVHFEDAWAAIPDRAAGRRIPRSCLEPRWLRYDEAGKFGTYVERFFELLGRERCMVSVFDDLVADPREQYRAMCAFLGIEPFAGTDFSPRRESRGVRLGWLQRLLKRPPDVARTYLAGQKFRQRERSLDKDQEDSRLTERIFSIRKQLIRWNRVPLEKRPIPVPVQNEIAARLRPEIDHLGALIGRDLSGWLQVREGRLG